MQANWRVWGGVDRPILTGSRRRHESNNRDDPRRRRSNRPGEWLCGCAQVVLRYVATGTRRLRSCCGVQTYNSSLLQTSFDKRFYSDAQAYVDSHNTPSIAQAACLHPHTPRSRSPSPSPPKPQPWHNPLAYHCRKAGGFRALRHNFHGGWLGGRMGPRHIRRSRAAHLRSVMHTTCNAQYTSQA